MKITHCFTAFFMGVCFLAGCQSESIPSPPMTLKAYYTDQPVTIDGRLDEPVWKKATSYAFHAPKAWLAKGNTFTQPGKVMLAWDEKYLYVAGRFDDEDILAYGKEDNMHHYRYGDLLEVFLWPDRNTWYWETYSTPGGYKSMFFFIGPGAKTMNCTEYIAPPEMAVASVVNGTLNRWKDRDTGWSTEMRIPYTELTQHGDKLPSEHWRILCARYNYDRLNDGIEYSSCPQLSVVNYHLRKEYAPLVFVKE
jgi:hypothetical protein